MKSENHSAHPTCAEKALPKCNCSRVDSLHTSNSTISEPTSDPTKIVSNRRWLDRILDLLKIGIGLANLWLGINKP